MLGTAVRVGPLDMSLLHWVNDALMVLFFLLVGLDLKDELVLGELSRPAKALLAVFAALGGMAVPALVYLVFNAGGPGQSGWGIPMATDIAFALACIHVLGARVPAGLRVFLMALAIVDDLGAIVVIAVFYSGGLNAAPLLAAAGIMAVLLLLNRVGMRNLVPYMVLGIALWYCFMQAGIHGTIAGVLLAFTIPLGADPRTGPLHRLAGRLQPLVQRLVLPVFALFNAGLPLAGVSFGSVTLGVGAGLILGKPAGILAASWLAVRLGLARLPTGADWSRGLGVGFIAGIGFTMSLFIAQLAFPAEALYDEARLGVLLGSLISASIGVALLLRPPRDSGTAGRRSGASRNGEAL